MHNLSDKSHRIGIALREAVQWAVTMVAALAVAGCAMPDSMGRRSDRDVVVERAQQRWDALVKNDFAAAYKYISPAGRSVVSPDAYAAQFKRGFWTGAKVDKVECATQEVCEADVIVMYQFAGLNTKTPVHEKWIKQDSTWWFVLER